MRPLVLILFLSSVAGAETPWRRPISDGPAPKRPVFALGLGAHYHYTNSVGDRLAGATYSKRFSNAVVADVTAGFLPVSWWYIGLVYEHWFAQRELTLSGAYERDTLKYYSVGAETGVVYSSNPRIFFSLLAGVLYPLETRVSAVGDNGDLGFKAARKISYQGRLGIGARCSKVFSLLFDVGYRAGNLGNLSGGGQDLLPGGASLDLSGFFAGASLLLHF